jgi:hypothetical protein
VSGRPPVAVIGMHRSGTSVVIASLERLGLFAGRTKDSNDEAVFFRRLNDWLLRQSGAAWDQPSPVRLLVERAEVRSLAAEYLAHVVRSVRSVGYLGWASYLRHRGLIGLPFAWGWKDPRTTFTMPVWTDVFPEARVIHVLRHGVDVAASLQARHRRALARRAEAFRRRKGIYAVWAKRTGFTDTLRCATLEGGFSLWEEYVDQGRANVRDLGSRGVELRYEDLLEDPTGSLRDLAAFCGLPLGEERVTEAASAVDTARSLAFRGDPELEAFAKAAAERLRARGYSP